MSVEIQGIESDCSRTHISIDGAPFIMEDKVHPFTIMKGKFILYGRPYRYAGRTFKISILLCM